MACTRYCDFGENLTSLASEASGLPRCIMGTVPPAALLLVIVVIVIIELYVQRRVSRRAAGDRRCLISDAESGSCADSGDAADSTPVLDKNKRCSCALRCLRTNGKCEMEYCSAKNITNPAEFVHGDNQTSFLYTLQQFLHISIMVLPVIDLITKAVMKQDTLQGYVLVQDCSTFFTWLLAFFVLRAESRRYFKSHMSRHSLGMLLFWAAAFIIENLAFISINNDHWWFGRKDHIQDVEFGLFVTKYCLTLLVFVLGLKAPGLYKVVTVPVSLNEDTTEESSGVRRHRKSAFKDLWNKTKIVWPFLWPSQRSLQLRVVTCFLLLGVGRAVNILVPYTYKEIVNHLTPGVDVHITNPTHLILIYVFLRFLQGGGTGGVGLLNNIRSFLWIRVQQFTSRTLQVRLFAHLHSLSLSWHLNRKTGEVIRMVDRGANSIYSLLSYLLFNILPTLVDVVVAIVYFSIAFNYWFGLIVLVTMTLYIVATVAITEWRTKFRRFMNQKDNAAKAKALDSLLNFETVKYYSGEDYEVNRLNDAINDYQVCEWQSMASLAFLNTIQNIVIILGLLAGSLYCGKLVADGKLLVGDFVLYISYTLQLYVPLNYFGTYYRMIQQSFIDMENMFDLFTQRREVVDAPDASPLKVTSGQIQFKNVQFGYSARKPIIKGISFTVFPGQTVALVGPSGSGKSTLIRLLYRFYDIDEGTILIDGQDISKVTQKSLRQVIGVVPQDTVLFNDNIGFNIRYGRIDANHVDVEEAAQAADIHSRILTFPDSYETIVGERGLKLSGGEKQRVAIARTVLKNPPLVLLDEATSALDTQTERNIQASLNNMCLNRTTIVVAHRLSTIVNADQILVIKEGEIMERGRHDELLELGGMYANMWLQQQAEEKDSVSSELGLDSVEEESKDEDKEK